MRVGHGIIYPLGQFRNSPVAISGTAWRPEEPSTERYHRELVALKGIPCATERSIALMLWAMRSQMFLDGNKRVATIIANHEMVRNGCGVISVPIELDGIFKTKLAAFYESGKSAELTQFILDSCIDGIDFTPYRSAESETEETYEP